MSKIKAICINNRNYDLAYPLYFTIDGLLTTVSPEKDLERLIEQVLILQDAYYDSESLTPEKEWIKSNWNQYESIKRRRGSTKNSCRSRL